MRVSYIVPCRNKVAFVEKAARSYLTQSYGPMEIVFFDQHSTDGTWEILQRLKEEFGERMRLLQCPENDWLGMPRGINIDIEWVHTQIAAQEPDDVILYSNADDYAHPDRTTRVVEVFKRFKPSWVGTRQRYEQPDGTLPFIGVSDVKGDRFIPPEIGIPSQVHSSASCAWSRDLWDKHGPMRDTEQCDVVLPCMAYFERGLYLIDEVLHTYVFHGSLDNMGVGGQILGVAGDALEALRRREVNGFNLTTLWLSVCRRIENAGFMLTPELRDILRNWVYIACEEWANVRSEMVWKRVQPTKAWAK